MKIGELSEKIGISVKTLYEYKRLGMPDPSKDAVEACCWIIRHRQPKKEKDLTSFRKLKLKAQLKLLELDYAKKRGEVMLISEYDGELKKIGLILGQRLRALAYIISEDLQLGEEGREKIQDRIRECLEVLPEDYRNDQKLIRKAKGRARGGGG
jgi:hypothetical protein